MVKVSVKQSEDMTVAFLRAKGGFAQVPAAFQQLYKWINTNGHEAQGPAILVYHTLPGQNPEEESLWEVRSKLTGNVSLAEVDSQDTGISRVNSMLTASFIHKGPYEGIEKSASALMDWISENGYEINGPYQELYYNGPDQATPEEYITELRFPVKRK